MDCGAWLLPFLASEPCQSSLAQYMPVASAAEARSSPQSHCSASSWALIPGTSRTWLLLNLHASGILARNARNGSCQPAELLLAHHSKQLGRSPAARAPLGHGCCSIFMSGCLVWTGLAACASCFCFASHVRSIPPSFSDPAWDLLMTCTCCNGYKTHRRPLP